MKNFMRIGALAAVVLSSLGSFSFIIPESFLHKDPNWWKEFVRDENVQTPIKPPVAITNDAVTVQELLLPINTTPTWFEKNREQIRYWGSLAFVGYVGLCFGKWWWSDKAIKNEIILLKERLRLAEEQEEIPVINETVRQIVHVEIKLNEDDNADLKQAVDRGDVVLARRLVDRDKKLDPLVQDFNEAHSILAAIKADYACVSCMEQITNANLFQVGSDRCFHFICVACKEEWRRSGRSGAHSCPACRGR